MRPVQAWHATLGQLQMDMPKASFDTWVRDTEFVSFEDGVFIVGVKNAYARDWLENRLTSTIVQILSGILNRTVDVHFIVWQESSFSEPSVKVIQNNADTQARTNDTNLNSKYGFHNFIVGTSNRLAHAASLAVAEKPSQAYNPLFLYGGVGLGKTHLLHAIGNHCLDDGLQVLYVSSEEFTNDLINAIRKRTTQAFREKYRRIDVLLIDDIQFIAGKESTQEEFFHTFNTLHGQDKQIVISSDRPPKAMLTLEERLRSRFEWGLAADIQPPDFETRMAILRSKADRENHQVPDEIIEVIARHFQSNIRELEGALTRIVAYANLWGMDMAPDLVNLALADMLPHRNTIEPEYLIQSVAEAFNISIEDIRKRNRSRNIALPRQIAMYLLREELDISLPQIGKILGGRDHTTVMYGCEKISDLLERDDKLRRKIVDIRGRLYENA